MLQHQKFHRSIKTVSLCSILGWFVTWSTLTFAQSPARTVGEGLPSTGSFSIRPSANQGQVLVLILRRFKPRLSHFRTRNSTKKEVPRDFPKLLVPKAGLEPARGITTRDFESRASAYSATSATPYLV